MYENPQPVQQLLEAPVDQAQDLAFAERAAVYLEKQGWDHRAVVRCLMEEFELDRGIAEAVASLAADDDHSGLTPLKQNWTPAK